jgi:hypothetical protein
MPKLTPVCVANIGPRGRRQRLRHGLSQLRIGGVVGVALALTPAPRWWRLAAAAPFILGALGVFQAYEQT